MKDGAKIFFLKKIIQQIKLTGVFGFSVNVLFGGGGCAGADCAGGASTPSSAISDIY